jgi:hypothetical protein
MQPEKVEARNGGNRPSLQRTDDHEPDPDTAAESAEQEPFASRLCLSAFTDVLEAIADWRDQLSAKVHDVELPLNFDQVADEIRTFSRLCFALGDFLDRRKVA